MLGLARYVAGSRGFSPASLFSGGETGFWYDPTDIQLAWRRNLGVMTTFGSLAGSAGAQYPDGTGWSNFFNTGGTRTYVASSVNPGEFAMDLSGVSSARNVIGFTFTPTSGTTYTVSFWIESVSGVTGVVSYVTGTLGTGGSSNTITAPTTTGRVSYTFTTGTGSGAVDVRLGIGAAGNESGSIRLSGFQVEVGSTASNYQQIVTPEISYLTYQPQPVMYTDSAGTTPVTGAEQAVGLILDKSKNLALGPELVTNGDFSNGTTGWSSTGTLVGGQLVLQVGEYVFQNITNYTIGKWYELSFTNNATCIVRFGFTGVAANYVFNVNGSCYFYVSDSSFSRIQLQGFGTAVTVDNISVRELPGNHAFQTTSAKRPVLKARYNLLTYSEQIDLWGPTTASVSPNVAVAPDGTMTADLIVGAGVGQRVVNTGVTPTNASTVTFAIYVKPPSSGTFSGASLLLYNSTTASILCIARFNGAAFSVTSTSNATATSSADGDGWYRISITNTVALTGTNTIWCYVYSDNSQGGGPAASVLAWGADLRPTSQATGAIGPTYQRIAAATDYDVAGFLPYLQFDGLDDALTTNSIDFATATSDGQARRNLFTFPTAFDDAAWTKSFSSITANTAVAPDGSTTADKLVEDTATNQHSVYQSVTVTAGVAYTASIYVKAAGRGFAQVRYENAGSTKLWAANVNLADGTFTLTSFGSPTGTSATVTNAGNGWWRVAIGVTTDTTVFSTIIYSQQVQGTNSYTGNGTDGILIWGAQLETGSTATAFQNIGTNQMTVFAGVRKLSDAALTMVAELSADSGANSGTFFLAAPRNAATGDYGWRSRGTVTANATSLANYAAPISNVLTGIGDIAAPLAELRVNGTQAASVTFSQGTGNFGNYSLFIGARNQTSLYFNGWMSQLIGVGAATSASQIVSTETYVNTKTGAY
jgi:hypothetical protein